MNADLRIFLKDWKTCFKRGVNAIIAGTLAAMVFQVFLYAIANLTSGLLETLMSSLGRETRIDDQNILGVCSTVSLLLFGIPLLGHFLTYNFFGRPKPAAPENPQPPTDEHPS